MKIQPVKTAIVGCGVISDAYLGTIINKFKILDMVGCCDTNADKAQQKAQKYGIKALTTDEMVADDSIALEVLHGIVTSSNTKSNQVMKSTFEKTPPIPRGYSGQTFFEFVEEIGIAH